MKTADLLSLPALPRNGPERVLVIEALLAAGLIGAREAKLLLTQSLYAVHWRREAARFKRGTSSWDVPTIRHRLRWLEENPAVDLDRRLVDIDWCRAARAYLRRIGRAEKLVQ